MIADLSQILSVESDSSGRALKQSRTHGPGWFARNGRKHLKAEIRAKVVELRSRVRILNTRIARSRCRECFELYRKAVRAAEADIQELLA